MQQKNSVILKIYIQPSIEQLDVCTVKLRHKNKITKFRIFVVPGDCPVLQGMSDTEVLDILKIMCETMEDPHKIKMFDFTTMQAFNGPSCKAKENSTRSRQTMMM